MTKLIDLTNKQFGRLLSFKKDLAKGNKTYWWCQCSCGAIKSIYSGHLLSGKIKSCGCLKKEVKYDIKAGFKSCSLCDKQKPLNEFYKINNRHNSWCTTCCSEKDKARRHDPKRKINHKNSNQTYRERNKERILRQHREYRSLNKDKISISQKEYSEKNKEAIRAKNSAYNKNPEVKERMKIKYQNNIQYRLSVLLRTRLNLALKGKAKNGSAVKNLGCSLDDFRQYLKNKFQNGMNWDNHGMWHIDHRKPLFSFDLTDTGQLKEACHYTNMEPLWAKDNLIKNKKINPSVVCVVTP